MADNTGKKKAAEAVAVAPKPPKAPKPKFDLTPDGSGLNARRYSMFKTSKRTVTPLGGPWEQEVVAAHIVDEVMSARLQAGFEPVYVDTLGLTPEGILTIWTFGKPIDREARFTEYRTLTRTLVSGWTGEGDHVTADGWDATLAQWCADGWSLLLEKHLGFSPEGIFLMALFVR